LPDNHARDISGCLTDRRLGAVTRIEIIEDAGVVGVLDVCAAFSGQLRSGKHMSTLRANGQSVKPLPGERFQT
jgi:hypothetical protein